jgi:isocitrate dehydrogenase
MGVDLPPASGIGIKPISPANTKRLVASAIASCPGKRFFQCDPHA